MGLIQPPEATQRYASGAYRRDRWRARPV